MANKLQDGLKSHVHGDQGKLSQFTEKNPSPGHGSVKTSHPGKGNDSFSLPPAPELKPGDGRG